MITASRAARASRSNCVPAANPRTSPGTGKTTLIVPRMRPGTPGEAGTAGRPTAARSVCNNETVPASWTSGHGSPVWPAATASYAVTDCFGAQRDNASRTSSGAALPASQALAHKDSETLGHHMISECSCFVRQWADRAYSGRMPVAVIWLIFALVLAGGEALTGDMSLLMLSGGALAAAGSSWLLDSPLWADAAVFLVVSVLLLVL